MLGVSYLELEGAAGSRWDAVSSSALVRGPRPQPSSKQRTQLYIYNNWNLIRLLPPATHPPAVVT